VPPATFVVARNPDPDSSLPYLLRLPLGGRLELKARGRWPARRASRKTLEDLMRRLIDGSLGFAVAQLAALPAAAVVVEERYSALVKAERVEGAFLCDLLTQLQVRCPQVQVVFCEARKLAEDWTYRFLAAALVQHRAEDAAASQRP
jgi:hypothetical protein